VERNIEKKHNHETSRIYKTISKIRRGTKIITQDLQKRRKQGEEWYKLVKEINHDEYS